MTTEPKQGQFNSDSTNNIKMIWVKIVLQIVDHFVQYAYTVTWSTYIRLHWRTVRQQAKTAKKKRPTTVRTVEHCQGSLSSLFGAVCTVKACTVESWSEVTIFRWQAIFAMSRFWANSNGMFSLWSRCHSGPLQM